MAVAGEAATHNKTLAGLRFEPAGDVAEVRLQLWPGSKDRLLARSGFHGKPVQGRGLENWRFQTGELFFSERLANKKSSKLLSRQSFQLAKHRLHSSTDR